MSEHDDSFEERLRELADQVSRSLQRMSEVDLDDLAERFGVDADGARTFADAAGQWLSDRLSGTTDPFFGERSGRPAPDRPPTPDPPLTPDGPPAAAGAAPYPSASPAGGAPRGPGPHPLDVPTEPQGRALSALDSGRWTVRPGSIELLGSGEGPPPPATTDLVGELRARDWIRADGTLTSVGRHALLRWCRVADATIEDTSADATSAKPVADAAPSPEEPPSAQ